MTDISPIRVYLGDDWLVRIALVDTTGAAIDLTGATVGADFWPSYGAAPVDLTAAGGGITVLQSNPALVLLTVPRSVTNTIEQNSALQRTFPTRAGIWVTDTLNRRQTVQIVPFQPLAPRSTDLPSAALVIGTVTAVLSQQGPAGPSGDLAPASAADALAGTRTDVVITPATLQLALEAYLAANPGSGGGGGTTPPTTSPGGGSSNTADFSDPNNAYLAGAL